MLRLPPSGHVRLVKGSHIVVPRLFEHDHAYIFQNADGRIVFAIPYERDFTLIGTTDEDFNGDPASPTRERRRDQLSVPRRRATISASRVTPDQVVHAYRGRAPALRRRRAQRAGRDARLSCSSSTGAPREAPLLTVYGGKITTYRTAGRGGAGASSRRSSGWARPGPPTRRCRAAISRMTAIEALVARARGLWPFLDRAACAAAGARLRHAARSRPRRCARAWTTLGERFGADLTAAEVRYLMRHEWAETADDVLWRRSKLGLASRRRRPSRRSTRFMETSGRAAAE